MRRRPDSPPSYLRRTGNQRFAGIKKLLEASAGFEPANDSFANWSLKPLGYDAIYCKIAEN